jgi:hypothetical protein
MKLINKKETSSEQAKQWHGYVDSQCLGPRRSGDGAEQAAEAAGIRVAGKQVCAPTSRGVSRQPERYNKTEEGGFVMTRPPDTMTIGVDRISFQGRVRIRDCEVENLEIWVYELDPTEIGRRPATEWIASHFENVWTYEMFASEFGIVEEGNYQVIFKGLIVGWEDQDGEWDEGIDIKQFRLQRLPDAWFEDIDRYLTEPERIEPHQPTRPSESDMITRPRADAMAKQLETLQTECESLRTRSRDAELENTKMRVLLRQMSSFTAIYGEIASEEAGKLLASLGPKL